MVNQNPAEDTDNAWVVGPVRSVCVVGGGFAGVATAKVLLSRGFAVTLLEKQNKLGGLWVDNYYGAANQSDKSLYQYAEKPYDEEASSLATAEEIQDYLGSYAAQHSLLPSCRFGVTVKSIRRAGASGQWKVLAENLDGETIMEIYDFVVLCTGSMGTPNIPKVLQDGQDSFQGTLLHSSQWKSPEIFEGKVVVVVGNGKGATDAVVGALPSAKEVHQVVRTRRWYVPAYILGYIPFYHFIYLRAVTAMLPHYHKPPTFTDRILRFIFSPVIWLFFRLLEINWMIYFRFPWNLVPSTKIEYDLAQIAVQGPKPEYAAAVRSGSVKVHTSCVEMVGKDRVQLTNGEEISRDVVIAATGYTCATKLFGEDVDQDLGGDSDGCWLYRNMIHPNVSNLAFVGSNVLTFMNPCTHSVQAAWLGKLLCGEFHLPDKKQMMAEISAVKQNRCACLGSCSQPSILIQARVIDYLDMLCRDMGSEPREGGIWGFVKYWLWPAFPKYYCTVVE